MHSKITLFALSLLLFAACEKNTTDPVDSQNPLLPNSDTKGVAMQVNNRNWYSDTLADAYFVIRGGINPEELTLVAMGGFENENTTTDRITILLTSVTTTGSFDLGGQSSNSANFTTVGANNSIVFYNTDATHTGTFTVTDYDEPNNRISGTFTFEAVSAFGEVELKGGVFNDVPMKQ